MENEIRIPDELHEAVEAFARAHGLTLDEAVAVLLRRAFGEEADAGEGPA
jgi:antitoxin component of RelBE/YafQ-DinJ toxin-antitoxin module